MGNSESANSGVYRKQILYYPKFDRRHFTLQNNIFVEHRDLEKILRGDYPELFENENVERVWIYSCPLEGKNDATGGTVMLSTFAGMATMLSFVPGISEEIVAHRRP